MPDGSGFHIDYKMLHSFKTLSRLKKTRIRTMVTTCLAGKQIGFVYTDIVDYQFVVDTKALLIHVIDSKKRLKNGSPCEITPTHTQNCFQ